MRWSSRFSGTLPLLPTTDVLDGREAPSPNATQYAELVPPLHLDLARIRQPLRARTRLEHGVSHRLLTTYAARRAEQDVRAQGRDDGRADVRADRHHAGARPSRPPPHANTAPFANAPCPRRCARTASRPVCTQTPRHTPHCTTSPPTVSCCRAQILPKSALRSLIPTACHHRTPVSISTRRVRPWQVHAQACRVRRCTSKPSAS